jgi:hypothetical protein
MSMGIYKHKSNQGFQKGRIVSEETCNKIRKSHLGKKEDLIQKKQKEE